MSSTIRFLLSSLAGAALLLLGLPACQQEGRATVHKAAAAGQAGSGGSSEPATGSAAGFALERGREVPGGKSMTYPPESTAPAEPAGSANHYDGCGDHVIESYRFKGSPALMAVDLAGEELWTFDPPGRALHNGVELTTDGKLLMYDGECRAHLVSEQGELLWTYTANQPKGWKELTQEILDGHDGFGMPDEFMDRATIWHPGGANCATAVPAADGGVYVFTAEELVLLDGAGEVVWSIDSPPFNTALFYRASDDGCILVTEEERPGQSGPSEYRAKGRMMSWEEIEEQHLSSRMTVSFISSGGEVLNSYETYTSYLHTTSSLFEGLDLVTPTSFGSVFIDTDCSLVAFDHAGRQLWRHDTPRQAGQEDREDHYGFQEIFTIIADPGSGNVIMATRCNNLYILDGSGGLVASSRLPATSRDNSSSYGSRGPALAIDTQGNIFGCHESIGYDGALAWAMDARGEILWEEALHTSGYWDGPVFAPDGTVHFAMGFMEMSDSGRRRWGEKLLAFWPDGELCYERNFAEGTSTSFPPEFADGSLAYLLTYNQAAGRLVRLPDLSPVWECDGQEKAVPPGSLVHHPDGMLLFAIGDVEWYQDHCL